MGLSMHEILTFAFQHGASDVHLCSGDVPAMRIDGTVRRLALDPLPKEETLRLAYSIMSEKQRKSFEENLQIDFSIGIEGLARFRVNVYSQLRGTGIALRQIPSEVLTLEQIKAPKVFQRIAEFRNGLVLVTGPTGSGKSTTIAAMIDHINKTRNEHILTIEDPIEFVHKPQSCLVNQRELGSNTLSFKDALKAALREDPDVILVGEMRDPQTIELALTAAETGHMVFGTLHTNSAPETIDRIIDSYPHEQQGQVRAMLSSALRAVVTQMLMKPKSGKGRIAVHEIMIVNAAIKNLIRENKIFQIPSIMQTAASDGMQTIDNALKDLVARGMISKEAAIGATGNANMFGEQAQQQAQPRTRYT